MRLSGYPKAYLHPLSIFVSKTKIKQLARCSVFKDIITPRQGSSILKAVLTREALCHRFNYPPGESSRSAVTTNKNPFLYVSPSFFSPLLRCLFLILWPLIIVSWMATHLHSLPHQLHQLDLYTQFAC